MIHYTQSVCLFFFFFRQSGISLIIAGLVVHVVFFISIFDIYFTSPLVHGMTPFQTPLEPPSKRLVLFVTDGLRADKFFGADRSTAPYMRDVIEKRGAWGISHTRVPTESRPGHVALIAGFYEDVSAVAKGWKENPVEFDSVFNESQTTWSWGSPDILPMFAKGKGIKCRCGVYFIHEFFEEAKRNASLARLLSQDRIVLFLHLLGLDTCGHSQKPHSEEYLRNIRIVDEGIKNISQVVDSYFQQDGRTSYIMTADHGMTNWGSHGAGHPHETLTPLVAWGAGIRRAVPPTSQDGYSDTFSEDWNLSHLKRSDVNQADIAPLMSSLIGIAFPLNSVGLLPLDYLNNTMEYKAKSIFANAQQILAQYQVKMSQKQETTLSALFKPFMPLTLSKQADKMRSIRSDIQTEKFQEAIDQSKELIQLALDGLTYYHSYDRFFLGVSVAFGFLGWMAFVFTLIIRDHTDISKHRTKMELSDLPVWRTERGLAVVFAAVAMTVIILLFVQSLPFSHYVYCLLPVILWWEVIRRNTILEDAWKNGIKNNVLTVLLILGIGGGGLEIIVMGFFRRELLSVGFISMAVWPWVSSTSKAHRKTVLAWSISCILVAIFPMMPVVGRGANYSLVTLAGVLALVCAVMCLWGLKSSGMGITGHEKYINLGILPYIQMGVIFASVLIVTTTAWSISNKEGLPLVNQLGSWTILGLSIILPLFSATQLYHRLYSIAMALFAPYLLMSTAHEGMFCLALCLLLFSWLQMEYKLAQTEKSISDGHKQLVRALDKVDFSQMDTVERHLIQADLRCAYFFVFLIISAFFGTGNIASINSFDPASVYCFLTVFSPFVMGALMLWKNLIPFLLVTCTFHAIHLSLQVPTKSLFLVVLLMSDFMGLQFFFMVQDHGSWLEIGTSISHYVVVMCSIIFLIMFLGLATILTSWRIGPKQTGKNL
ncbi:GPI ethanolamine phosphate transferase 1 [Lingula anatina]|uniref:GPI ethanolamine phosphate transferase 1 n=1 Tax=Lingula anatina TaxID=7574 RepID=A0A1S3H469_LINAN|nr:GPI ethanolamine phosphate transferase 1 [Lingula anatina]|eukprot:XP_013380261.1 GPI ethanolamine phosphate transferase 1 [Lingula anatina]